VKANEMTDAFDT